jgi:hypothetical protein
MNFPYTWLTHSETDLIRFKQCFDENGSPKTLEHLRWQYLQSYQKVPPLAVIGLSNTVDPASSLSGIYATFQSKFYYDGKIVTATQSLNTLTSKEFRGKGLFNQFAGLVYEKSMQQGIAFVYGFPNGNSAHGFFKKLGWTRLDPVPFLIKPLNLSYLVSRLPFVGKLSYLFQNIKFKPKHVSLDKNLKLQKNVVLDERYDDLWLSFRKGILLGIDRRSEYMRWRLSKPGESYLNIACLDESGRIMAICFFTGKDKHGGKIGYILDTIHRPGSENEADAVLSAALSMLARSGSDAVLAWCFEHSPNYRSYRKSGFFSLPQRLRPIQLHFGARAFDTETQEVTDQRSSWYISYLDSDTV